MLIKSAKLLDIIQKVDITTAHISIEFNLVVTVSYQLLSYTDVNEFIYTNYDNPNNTDLKVSFLESYNDINHLMLVCELVFNNDI